MNKDSRLINVKNVWEHTNTLIKKTLRKEVKKIARNKSIKEGGWWETNDILKPNPCSSSLQVNPSADPVLVDCPSQNPLSSASSASYGDNIGYFFCGAFINFYFNFLVLLNALEMGLWDINLTTKLAFTSSD